MIEYLISKIEIRRLDLFTLFFVLLVLLFAVLILLEEKKDWEERKK